jgi:predicted ArsR family transcriptional regulator
MQKKSSPSDMSHEGSNYDSKIDTNHLNHVTNEFKTFSPTKRQILLILKREGEIDLQSLSEKLNISKMGIHKHITDLEEMGLVDRAKKRGGVGRPRLVLKLADSAADIFPRAYAALTVHTLEYIEEKLGRDAVEDALRRRQQQTAEDYQKYMEGKSLPERVKILADLRNKEGYMAEMKRTHGSGYELYEYNCPILAVADKYFESCTLERKLFASILDADVETTHRVVDNDYVCRFVIKKKRGHVHE